MISDKMIAKSINELCIETQANFIESIGDVKSSCTEAEFHIYRKQIGKILGAMFVDILCPIYKEHPDLNYV